MSYERTVKERPIPLEKAEPMIEWPRLEGVDEEKALKKKTEAVYEAI